MILYVCKYGHSRSAAAVRLTHRLGIDAICCGWKTASSELLHQLCAISSQIVVMEKEYARKIPEPYWYKTAALDIGPDKWRSPYDDELCELLKPQLASLFHLLKLTGANPNW